VVKSGEGKLMGRRRKMEIFLGASGFILQDARHGSSYAKETSCEKKFLGLGNSVGTNFLWEKNKGLNYSSNPLLLFAVAGLGWEPRTFGL
jgi:hypothetical protein